MAELQTDLLGAPYTCETCRLLPDDEGEVFATLVHRSAGQPTRKAVLHVHGFCDYFFQTVAGRLLGRRNGYDFYALDLRKYGRSLRPHQTPNYVADLSYVLRRAGPGLPAHLARSTTTSCSPRTPRVV